MIRLINGTLIRSLLLHVKHLSFSSELYNSIKEVGHLLMSVVVLYSLPKLNDESAQTVTVATKNVSSSSNFGSIELG